MAVQMEELIEFIQTTPDPRELKRALAVQMVMQNYKHSEIGNILRVSVGFVSKWKYIFVAEMLNFDTKLHIISDTSFGKEKCLTFHNLLHPMNIADFLTHKSLEIAKFI
jgi:hypothetical protein